MKPETPNNQPESNDTLSALAEPDLSLFSNFDKFVETEAVLAETEAPDKGLFNAFNQLASLPVPAEPADTTGDPEDKEQKNKPPKKEPPERENPSSEDGPERMSA